MIAYFTHEIYVDAYLPDDECAEEDFRERISDAKWDLVKEADDKLMEIIDEFDEDGDLVKGYDVDTDEASIELFGDSDYDKEIAIKILSKLQELFDDFSESGSIEVYGEYYSYDRNSYDPPESREYEVDYTLSFDYDKEIKFDFN